MKPLTQFFNFFLRFRYPVSLPEDVASALGIDLSNSQSFDEFIAYLISQEYRPTRVSKFMFRGKAEAAFQGALKKERFKEKTIFSYYFSEGWMEFILLFDEQSRLRRIYLQHKSIDNHEGIEIPLFKE